MLVKENSRKKFLEPPLLPTKDTLYIHKKIIIIKENLCRLSSWAESRNYRMQLTIKLSLLTQSPDFVPKCHDLSHLTHVKYHRKLCKNSTTKLYWSTWIRSIMSTCITFWSTISNLQSEKLSTYFGVYRLSILYHVFSNLNSHNR